MKNNIQKTYDQSNNSFKKIKLIDNEYTDLIKKNVDKNSKVLDLGCGGGRLTLSINKYVNCIIGIDFSKELISSAKKNTKANNVTFKVMDGEKLDFQKDSFDVIVSHAVLNKKMCRANIALKSAYKILKPKGKIIIKMIYSTWGKEFNFSGGYNSGEIKKILKDIGYKKIKVKIQRQKFTSSKYKDTMWVRSTEAINLSPIKVLEEFFSPSKKEYCFDDSFMIVYAEKGA
jgi:ubiquinone/menaquinone biosynthesis C-methylase UbiE